MPTDSISSAHAFIIMGIVLAALQFLYRYWDKKDTKEIAEILKSNIELIIKTVDEGVKSFDPHIERTKLTHEWAFQLKEAHLVKDSTGLPLMYRNVQTENTMEELVKIAHKTAQTELHISEILRNIKGSQNEQLHKIELLSEKIESHQKVCTQQYNELKDKGHS